MLKKLLIVLGVFLAGQTCLWAQGTLKGVVKDENGEPLPTATVRVMQGAEMVSGTTTDFDGLYTVKPLAPGKYDVLISFPGYTPQTIKDVTIAATGFTTAPEVTLTSGLMIEEVIIDGDKIPLIDKTTAESGTRLTGEDIARMPATSVDGIAAMTAGISYSDGGAGTARGEGGMVTYVGGVRKQGSVNIPKEAIGELQYILGGTPARYGEARGGVQVITLNPPARKFLGSVKYETSELFDKRGYNRLDMYFTGPIWKKHFKDEATGADLERTIIGYRLSVFDRLYRAGLYRPSDSRLYALTDEARENLEKTPLYIDPLTLDGSKPASVYSTADYYRADKFTRIASINQGNTWNNYFYAEGGLDISFTQNMTLAINSEFTMNNYRTGSASNFVANNDNNSKAESKSIQISGEFNHRFPDKPNSTSIFKKVMYSLTGSYTFSQGSSKSVTHEDNIFDYGYIGRFTTNRFRSYALQRYTIDGVETDAWVQNGFGISGINFDPTTTKNPLLANYNIQLYDERNGIRPYLVGDAQYMDGTQPALELIRNMRGLVNGNQPSGAYGLFAMPGVVSGTYSKSEQEAIYLQAKASTDIGNHALEIGFQYDRLTNRSYSLSPVGLWTLMYNLTNRHLVQLDQSNPMIDNSGTIPIVSYNYLYGDGQSTFDKALRARLGYAENGTEWIDINNLLPSTFSMDMFSADELLNSGSPYVSYSGYDYTGNKISGKHSLNDFFNNTKSRTLDAWSPEYMAAYIQDQFYISDLIFNVGVRMDRFNGNQMVMKDPYLLWEAYTVGETKSKFTHPASAKDDWVVYVNQASDPNSMTVSGYRSGTTWYTAQGLEVADPMSQIKGNSGQPTPYAKDPGHGSTPSVNMFEEYDPQYVVMPRVAFSFPVSDESQFKASYDIIANRPSSQWQANYVAYLFMDKQSTISNPNLKPEKITNYEIGFQQVLSKSSALSLNAYYKETRDLIQLVQYTGADPNPNYFSYDNFDFKTTKGFTIQYDLRQTKNFRMVANFTLQYAEGTSLPPSTMQSLIKEGYPSLKILNPISDDIRNAFKVNFDYRFGFGKNYNGPTSTRKSTDEDGKTIEKTTKWLQGFGANLQLVAQSGRPYTRRLSNTQNTIVGSYNGARLPWQFFVDLVLDKTWMIKVGKDKKKDTRLTAALTFQNILDIRNIVSVFPVTGDPDDNGYLTDPDTQTTINANYPDSDAYRIMYEYLTMQNQLIYANYSQPRFIKIGLTYTF